LVQNKIERESLIYSRWRLAENQYYKKNIESMRRIFFILIFLLTTSSIYAKKYTTSSKEDIQDVIAKSITSSSEGNFITFKTNKALEVSYINLGGVPGFKQYSSSFRNKSCWMTPSVGAKIADIPAETQFLLIDRGSSDYLMFIPLVDDKARCSLGGIKSDEIELIAETGDSTLLVNEFLGLYMLSGNNPHQMIKKAMTEIQQELKTFKLRSEKSDPWLADYFGWCSWNAMFIHLSTDTLTYAMKHFKQNDIPVKYMIVDNGWLSEYNAPKGDPKRGTLTSFAADKTKFPKGLAPMIADFKENYGLEKMIIWQSLWGTFTGLNKESFGDLAIETNALPVERMVKNVKRVKEEGDINEMATVGKVFYPGYKRYMAVPDWIPYYDQYFDYLRKQGADGVKIDAMTWVESVGHNRGGRVTQMKEMMKGVQGAVNTHFNNEMINCSSCSNDYLFNALSANLTRSSGDFFPEKPETHGFHIYTNAHTSFWMGEIVMPDWDMFQSGHEAGDFHAAARSISGGPIYTTEVIGDEDTSILKKLMCSNGRLPRCKDVGRVCAESLFTDPASNDKAVKFFNTNLLGGVVGAFNCSYNPGSAVTVSENIKATDIENISGDKFAVYSFSNGALTVKSKNDAIPVNLDELDFDLFTYVPVQNGFAPIGVVTKYNPGGMISEFNYLTDDLVSLKLLEGGKLVAYSEEKPVAVFANSKPVKFSYISNKLEINVPEVEDVIVTIKF
jgi:raffinose synthase